MRTDPRFGSLGRGALPCFEGGDELTQGPRSGF